MTKPQNMEVRTVRERIPLSDEARINLLKSIRAHNESIAKLELQRKEIASRIKALEVSIAECTEEGATGMGERTFEASVLVANGTTSFYDPDTGVLIHERASTHAELQTELDFEAA